MKQDFLSLLESLTVDIDTDHLNEDEVIYLPSVDIKITLNDDDTFNIYRDFCYPHRFCEENFENEWRSALEEVTVEQLTSVFGITPTVDFDCGMGCPFDSSLVGYWKKDFDVEFIKAFINACDDAESRDEDITLRAHDFIAKSISEVSEQYGLMRQNKNYFFSEYRKLIVFTHRIDMIGLDFITKNIEELELPMLAVQYFCGKRADGQPVTANINSVNKFFSICDHFRVDKSEFRFYSVENSYLYIDGSLKALIPFESEPERKIDEDYRRLAYKLNKLCDIRPQINVSIVDFSNLTYSNFESMCYDLLNKMGFIDVHPVGNSNASDGGKDLICIEEYKTLTGTERRKWIWQCKHSKTNLGRKDISEIGDLLYENKATAYGLFCSSELTPQCIERLELKSSDKLTIKYFGKIELSTLLNQYADLKAKYKLLGGVRIE